MRFLFTWSLIYGELDFSFFSFLFLLLCYKKHCLSLPCTCLLLHSWDWFSKGSNVDWHNVCVNRTFTYSNVGYAHLQSYWRLSFFLNMHLENQCNFGSHFRRLLSLQCTLYSHVPQVGWMHIFLKFSLFLSELQAFWSEGSIVKQFFCIITVRAVASKVCFL